MSTEQTEPKWRLLDQSEALQAGDQQWLEYDYGWNWVEITRHQIASPAEQCPGTGCLYRRRMTGAEIHGGELLSLAEKGLALMDVAADHDDPPSQCLPRLCQEYREAYCDVLDKIDP